ncbi:SIMPL domain-containing protein [Flavobacterium sp. SM15]|uniref:SIMPL domain-containing protein n=1 Tax=Flavobacterium sp. SM15 TaxID=2908005 RepID=UPI001EDA8305|nr:SIMPL domain-containing protein [Flavobacterium sp. SM15]MCG2612584.1 SIMPL domain-containing protein [Flavobacterium sp. SM15]
MIKKLTLITALILTSFSFAQTNNGNELSSEGNSKVKVKPDIAIFRISIEKRNTIEKVAIKELNEEVEKLSKTLLNLGFTSKNIKVSDYDISKNENEENKNEYVVTNSLNIEFGLDNKLIDNFYQELQQGTHSDLNVDFVTQISSELEKSTKLKLVQLAIEDAKRNAENMSKSLNVKLGDVKNVSKFGNRLEYSGKFADLKVAAAESRKFSAPMPKTSFDKFEVEEEELEESITITFEILKK